MEPTQPPNDADDTFQTAFGETREQLNARMERDHAVLRSEDPRGISESILRTLVGFDVSNVHTARDAIYPPEFQMARAAAAMTKAVAIALAERTSARTVLDFTDEDAIRVLGAVSCYLEHGSLLVSEIRDARDPSSSGSPDRS